MSILISIFLAGSALFALGVILKSFGDHAGNIQSVLEGYWQQSSARPAPIAMQRRHGEPYALFESARV